MNTEFWKLTSYSTPDVYQFMNLNPLKQNEHRMKRRLNLFSSACTKRVKQTMTKITKLAQSYLFLKSDASTSATSVKRVNFSKKSVIHYDMTSQDVLVNEVNQVERRACQK